MRYGLESNDVHQVCACLAGLNVHVLQSFKPDLVRCSALALEIRENYKPTQKYITGSCSPIVYGIVLGLSRNELTKLGMYVTMKQVQNIRATEGAPNYRNYGTACIRNHLSSRSPKFKRGRISLFACLVFTVF